MTSLHIRDLPEDTLRVLRSRAAEDGQSLQAFVRALLVDEAETLSPREAARRAQDIGGRTGVTERDILAARDDARLARA